MWVKYKDTIYEVSRTGKVRNSKTKKEVGRKQKNGRYIVRLGKNGPSILRNKMVAQVFLDWHEGCEVHHRNYNPSDDRVANLVVCSPQQHRRYHNKCKFVFRFDKDWTLIECYNSSQDADKATGNDHRMQMFYNNGKIFKGSYWICLDIDPIVYESVTEDRDKVLRRITQALECQVNGVRGLPSPTSHPNISKNALQVLRFD